MRNKSKRRVGNKTNIGVYSVCGELVRTQLYKNYVGLARGKRGLVDQEKYQKDWEYIQERQETIQEWKVI